MRRFVFVCAALIFVSLGLTAQFSVIVLDTHAWHTGSLPDGWQVKVNHGTPEISTEGDAGGNYLHLRSHRSSFALERGVDVDPAQLPYLTWRWKVTKLPEGGDFRHASTDDQAAQVLVAFADRHVLTYIWDSTAPLGSAHSASSIPLVHVYAIVCRSGGTEVNQWVAENHNLEQDYQRAYGRPAPRIRGIRLQINSQHTGTSAESYFGDVSFRATP